MPKPRLEQILHKNKHRGSTGIALHHEFMTAYGWIPLEEFTKLKIPTVLHLLELIQNDKEELANATKRRV